MPSSVLERPPQLDYPPQPAEVMLSERARERREFDILASVYLLRADLMRSGAIRPETKSRVFEEELTFVAEAIDAPLTTTFEQSYANGRLEAVDGTPLMQMLENGRQTALEQAQRDPRYAFHAYRAESDWQEGRQLEALMAGHTPGNTIMSFATFPEEAARTHGDTLLTKKGYQPARKLSFVRLYHKADDETLRAITISFDNSNLGAFRYLAKRHGVTIPPEVTSDEFGRYLVNINLNTEDLEQFAEQTVADYDQHLSAQTGKRHRQGRRESDTVEAWSFIAKQADLVETYYLQLIGLARQNAGPQEERAKKELTYSFWALLKERLDAYKRDPEASPVAYPGEDAIDREYRLLMEMNGAGGRAARNHELLVTCGGTVDMQANESLFELSPQVAMQTILLGNKESSETITWTKGYCRIKGCRSEVTKTKVRVDVGGCRVCRDCQAIFDAGDDPHVIYAIRNAKQERKQQDKAPRSIIKLDGPTKPTTKRP